MSQENAVLNQSPFQMLAHSAPVLIARGVVMAVFQFFAIRAFLGEEDEALLAEFSVFSAVEGLIFILVFSGLHIVSAKGAHLHAEELRATAVNNPRDVENPDAPFDPAVMGVLYRQSVMFGAVLMVPTALLCLTAPALFRLAGQSEKTVNLSVYYFSIAFLAYFADMLYRTRARIEIARSAPMVPLVADSVESVLHAAGTYVLAPKLGVLSVAIAYAIAAATTAAGMKLYSDRCPELEKYQLYRFNWDEVKKALDSLRSNRVLTDDRDISFRFNEVLSGGLNLSFKFSIIYLTQIVTTYFCSVSGNAASAGLQAAIAYSYIVSLAVSGGSDAANVVIGRLLKNNPHEARKMGHFILLASFIFSALCALGLFACTDFVASLFLNKDASNQQDLPVIKDFLRVQSIMSVSDSVSFAGGDVLSSYLETEFPFSLSVVCVFFLNSSLAVIAQTVFQVEAAKMYAVQMAGSFLMMVAILERWYHNDKPESSVSQRAISCMTDRVSGVVECFSKSVSYGVSAFARVWQKPTLMRESPRNLDVESDLSVVI